MDEKTKVEKCKYLSLSHFADKKQDWFSEENSDE